MANRKNALFAALIIVLGAGCGGTQSSTNVSGGQQVAGSGERVGPPATNASETAPAGSGERRSGLAIHIQNLHANGSLPSEPNTQFDRLHVTFELDLQHSGTEPISGLNVVRARLVHDDGREIVFGVLGQNWDGRLAAGARLVVAFEKTPDSASPPPNRAFCGIPMRLEVTMTLAGRQARATSRRVQIECPPGE